MAEARLEPLDVENLRPHYARTLWAWRDALEAQLDARARADRASACVRAYRLYLAGSAMCFEHGWISLHQMLRRAAERRRRRRARCAAHNRPIPFNRGYMYPLSRPMIYKFKSKAAGDVIMMGPTGDQVLRIDRPRAGRQGHHRGGRDAGRDRGARAGDRRGRGRARAGRGRGGDDGETLPPREASACASAPGRWSR